MKKRVPMQTRSPRERVKDFSEVALGYTKEEALLEAERCLDCKHAPCVGGCPVEIDIPKFIREIREGRLEEAAKTIYDANFLPGICGRVCPQENQCEARCVRARKGEAVAIGRLERFASDNHQPEIRKIAPDKEKSRSSVPARRGFPARRNLRSWLRSPHFRSLHAAGGVLTYGIPEFRLPQRVVDSEVGRLLALGIKIHYNTVIGRTKKVRELFNEGFQAVFIGSGAGYPKFMKIPGENLNGVLSANEFLTRINLMKAHLPEYDTPLKKMRKVAVVGGGNVAMDAARSALRIGAEEVHLVYRRGREEMPARLEEVRHAEEEGVRFRLLANPVRILGESEVSGIECQRMELGEPDESGRRRPVAVPDSDFVISCDAVIMAIGNHPNPILASSMPELKTNKWGCIEVDERLRTSVPGVYAGGDVVTGSATVILAMGAGKKAPEKLIRI